MNRKAKTDSRCRFHRAASWLLAACTLPLLAQSPQRDAPAAAMVEGAGEISGVVVTDEAIPHPIRRAVVTASGDLPAARSAITDDEGRFTFGRLPAGRFTITVKKAAYLPAAYGAMRPGRPGTPIALARDQRTRVTIVMARGAVLTGTVRNQVGMPLAGMQVGALDLRSTSQLDTLFDSTEFVTTDDRGVYRIYGLMPGEYAIAALPRTVGSGEIGTRSAAEMDAVLAQLAQRGTPTTATTLGAPATPPAKPIPPAPAVGFAPSYFPGTALFQDATHLKLAAGEEHGGVDFQAGAVPVVSVSGTVSGDVRNLAAVQLSMIIGGQRQPLRMGTSPILGQRPDADGRFKWVNLAPGQYRIIARGRRGQNDVAPTPVVTSGGAGSGRVGVNSSGGSATLDPNDYLFAVADVEVRGQEIAGLSLALQPGSRMAGRLVLDSATPPAAIDLAKFRLNVSPPGGTYMSQWADGTIIGNTFSATQPAQIRPDGAFDITNIAPGVYNLLCTPPADFPKGWWLRSALLNGRDLLDQTIAFEPGVNLGGVTVTMSDKHTELSGVLQTAGGVPAPQFSVIVFPADRSLWRAGSRRMQSARPGSDGTFVVRDLPGGDYVITAVTDMDPMDWQDSSFLDQVGPAGVRVTLVDGKATRQDLQIARVSEPRRPSR